MQEAHPNSYGGIYSKLVEARGRPLSECKYKFLSPVEKLGEPKTYEPWEFSTCAAVTVRLKDILNKSGKSERPIYKEIQKAGGIHAYIGFDGNVILTSIMEDQTIWGFTQERYANIIDTLKPDYYITGDGETYNNEPNLSGSVEIPRMIEEARYLLNNVKHSKPIGLVKGCTAEQIGEHADSLVKLGINDLVFHTGDFLARGSDTEVAKAREYTREIRKRAKGLLLYGIGLQIPDFFVADGFITQNHYVNALSYGQRLVGMKWAKGEDTNNRETIMGNLKELDKLVIQRQVSHLSNWVREG